MASILQQLAAVPTMPARDAEPVSEPAAPEAADAAANAEARAERMRLEAEVAQSDQRYRAAEMRANMLMQSLAPPPPAPPPLPSLDQDPVGHIVEAQRRQNMQLGAMAGAMQAQAAQQQEQQAAARVARWVNETEAEFAAKTPDYAEAVKTLAAAHDRDLATLGFDPATRRQIMKSDIQQLVRMAAQQGKSPAQLAYEMARHHGHDPARTARAANALTPEKLLRMDPDEFDKAIQTPAGRAILGG